MKTKHNANIREFKKISMKISITENQQQQYNQMIFNSFSGGKTNHFL